MTGKARLNGSTQGRVFVDQAVPPLNAEGVLYDLNKLQKSLFNQKRRREIDPVLV
jgi:hypothetical protein